MKKNIHLIAAARPNFMKVAPLYHALAASDWADVKIVHTGQHYDYNMSDAFFDELGLPAPAYHLGIGSGSHAEQTGGVMIAYEKVCMAERPDCVVVCGDVNSTVACALVAAKLWIPSVHLEAGLRSGDRSMPEEINRLATDAISDLLWTPSPDADKNLGNEGAAAHRVVRIGNIMIDSYELLRERIEAAGARTKFGLDDTDYAVVTLHRPSNVDARESLAPIIDELHTISRELQLVLVGHPRTMHKLDEFGLKEALQANERIRVLDPLPYVSFMNVVTGARLAITDSGGLQEETTYLGIPCLTMRPNTERPITVTEGTNRLVTVDTLRDAVANALNARRDSSHQPPEFWDGKTAQRAVQSLKTFLEGENAERS